MKAKQSPAVRPYNNFKAAMYVRVYEVQKMADLDWLEETYAILSSHVRLDKVYLEVHRDRITADEKAVRKAREFFERHGVGVSGGIAYVVSEPDRFRSYCYSEAEGRETVREVAQYAAGLFDEVILDDFFFTSCRCGSCIEAKGERSWSEFRLEQMRGAARDLVVGPAKKVNPQVKLIIKYPNWYDHFQFCGYDLEAVPDLFEMIYTGTETRDPVYTHQHLQPYQSYAIMRYFENVAPGRNGGGWVDPFRCPSLDRYAEQLRLTLFAKAREIMLFSYGHLLEELIQPDGTARRTTELAHVAGYELDRVDAFLGQLGQPLGVKCYKPYHSHGEDFLPNYIGMLGIPIEITPRFPADDNVILLTEQASFDDEVVERIEQGLLQGRDMVITSGLVRALQGKGMERLVELEHTGKKALVRRFSDWVDVYPSEFDILIPQICYPTNDAWELITALDSGYGSGYPILLGVGHGKGRLYVLTVPDNAADLYAYPQQAVTAIRKLLLKDSLVYADSPTRVGLFVYDNDTFIVASFRDHPLSVRLVVRGKRARLEELQTGRSIEGHGEGDGTVFEASIGPHGYLVFKVQ